MNIVKDDIMIRSLSSHDYFGERALLSGIRFEDLPPETSDARYVGVWSVDFPVNFGSSCVKPFIFFGQLNLNIVLDLKPVVDFSSFIKSRSSRGSVAESELNSSGHLTPGKKTSTSSQEAAWGGKEKQVRAMFCAGGGLCCQYGTFRCRQQ